MNKDHAIEKELEEDETRDLAVCSLEILFLEDVSKGEAYLLCLGFFGEFNQGRQDSNHWLVAVWQDDTGSLVEVVAGPEHVQDDWVHDEVHERQQHA